MEIDNEVFKQNDADQVKRNATKSEYTNYAKNINDIKVAWKVKTNTT